MISLTKFQNMGVFPEALALYFWIMIAILSFMMCRHNVIPANVVSYAKSYARQDGLQERCAPTPLERFDARTTVP